MVAQWLIQLLIAVALQVVSVILTPKPKGPQPSPAEQSEYPTAEAGVTITKMWGTGKISNVNIIGDWDKSTRQYQVRV